MVSNPRAHAGAPGPLLPRKVDLSRSRESRKPRGSFRTTRLFSIYYQDREKFPAPWHDLQIVHAGNNGNPGADVPPAGTPDVILLPVVLSKGGIPERKRRPEEDVINTKIFVGNLSYETTRTELEQLFSEIGEIVDVFLPTDRNSGRPRGFAFVEFVEASSAAEAIERFDGKELNNRELRVKEAEERRSAPSFSHAGGGGSDFRGPKRPKTKGSRRNIRSRKRGF